MHIVALGRHLGENVQMATPKGQECRPSPQHELFTQELKKEKKCPNWFDGFEPCKFSKMAYVLKVFQEFKIRKIPATGLCYS
jgi:hypothetical protein